MYNEKIHGKLNEQEIAFINKLHKIREYIDNNKNLFVVDNLEIVEMKIIDNNNIASYFPQYVGFGLNHKPYKFKDTEILVNNVFFSREEAYNHLEK